MHLMETLSQAILKECVFKDVNGDGVDFSGSISNG